jgi:predicted SnoaL-like aldol condensation-catalyzing enzyme
MTAMVAGFASGDLSRVHDVSVARSGFSELTTSVLDTVAEGDKVVARIEWRGIRTSGETERRETIDILRVVNGKAVEHWGARS